MLRLSVLPTKGRSIVAEAHINAGTEILVAEPYAVVTYPGYCVCGSPGRACTACKHATYCGTACQKKDWSQHKQECSSLKSFGASGRHVPPTIRLVARVLRRLRADTVLPLRNVVARPTSSGLLLTDDILQALSSGGALAALDGNRALHTEEQMIEYGQMAGMVLQLLRGDMTSVEPVTMPTPQDVLDMFCKIRCNVFTLADGEMRPWGIGLYLSAALLNHSCEPNALALFRETTLVLRTLRCVEVGEEVCVSYTDVAAPASMRRAELASGYYFSCTCGRCAVLDQYVRKHGPIEPSPDTPLPLAPFCEGDRRMLGVWCEAAGCKGKGVGMHVIEMYLLDADGEAEAGDEEDGEHRQKRTGGSPHPQAFLHSSECTLCGCVPSTKLLASVQDTLSAIDSCVSSLRDSGRGVDAATVTEADALLTRATTILHPEHHRLVALLNAMTNSAISRKDWECASRYGLRMLAAARASHPPGHPIPALQQGLQGKLLVQLDRPGLAIPVLAEAVAALQVSHGESHPVTSQLEGLLEQARSESQGSEASESIQL